MYYFVDFPYQWMLLIYKLNEIMMLVECLPSLQLIWISSSLNYQNIVYELSEYCLGTIWNIVWIRPIQALYANRPKTATNNCMCIGLNFVTSLFRCSLNIVTVYAELYPEAPQKDSLRTIGNWMILVSDLNIFSCNLLVPRKVLDVGDNKFGRMY